MVIASMLAMLSENAAPNQPGRTAQRTVTARVLEVDPNRVVTPRDSTR